MAEIVKPIWPARQGNQPYPFLASAMISPDILRNCCIKEATVTAVNSRQTVTVSYSGGTAEDVPVWVHTDVGTRRLRLFGEEAEDPQEYYKDAGLMFPLPGGSPAAPYDPKVLIVVHTDPRTQEQEVLCVCHVLQSVDRKFPDDGPPRTYKIYLRYLIGHVGTLPTPSVYSPHYFLYDLINDEIATIPSYAGEEPSLPMVKAEGLSSRTPIDNYITRSGGVRLLDETSSTSEWIVELSSTRRGCASVLSTDWGHESPPSCFSETGEPQSPGWTGTQEYAECLCHAAFAWNIGPLGTGNQGEVNPLAANIPRGGFGVYYEGESTGSSFYSSGIITYSNGLIFERSTGYSAESTGGSGIYETDYTEDVTLSFSGEEKQRSINFHRPASSLFRWCRRPVRIRLPRCSENFLCDLWCWDSIDIFRKEDFSGNYAGEYVTPGGYEDAGWLSPTFAIQGTSLFQNIRDSIVEMLDDGSLPWLPANSSLNQSLQVSFSGFYIIPHDIRIDLLQAEEA